MKPFSFVHLADTHLGYMQYNLPERKEDFTRVFIEAVDKILQFKPSFVILAGDIFDDPRPSNQTLATAIKELRRLKEAEIKVFAVDGSHDLEPNVLTGTILIPLHNAGLLTYLPRLDGGCYVNESYYIYGIRSSRSLREADEKIPEYLARNPPKPNSSLFNIFVFHGTLDVSEFVSLNFKPDLRAEYLKTGFNYYAGGHIHQPILKNFKNGLLAYPGSLETTTYIEAETPKGFYYVEVPSLKEPPTVNRIKIDSSRKFIVKEKDISGLTTEKIFDELSKTVIEADVESSVVVLVIKGVLPEGVKKSQLDIPKIRSLAKKALYVSIVNQLTEKGQYRLPVELKESRELKTAAYEHFLKIYKGYGFREEFSVKLAKKTLDLIPHLLKGEEEEVKKILEVLADDYKKD
ncbi:MAG: metallophosphoesterase family protein [Candidatus Bathyarchaeota archaeon]